jgi:hypothetical protein
MSVNILIAMNIETFRKVHQDPDMPLSSPAVVAVDIDSHPADTKVAAKLRPTKVHATKFPLAVIQNKVS